MSLSSLSVLSSKRNFWLVLSFLISIRFWLPVGLSKDAISILDLLVIFYLIYIFVKKNNVKMPYTFHYKSIYVMIFLSLLSVFSCYFLHGQSILSSLIVYRIQFAFLIYFVLWYEQVTIKTLYKILGFIVCGYIFISLVQQVTYPIAPFGGRTVNSAYSDLFCGDVEKRFGLYRFMVSGYTYLYLYTSLFLYYNRKFDFKNFIFILFLVLGVFLTGTRQYIIQFFFLFFLFCTLNVKGFRRFLLVIVLAVSVIFVFSNLSILFGDMGNVSDDFDTSRSLSWDYYAQSYTSSIPSIFFGNGIAQDSSSFGRFSNLLYDDNIILSDVGLLASLYIYGFIYIFCLIACSLKIAFNRNLHPCFKSLLISSFINPFLFIWGFDSFFLYGIIFYVCDMNIYENSKLG
jgi:hypothetical protein